MRRWGLGDAVLAAVVLCGSGCSVVDAIKGNEGNDCQPYCEITYRSVGADVDLIDLVAADVDDDSVPDLVILGADSRLYVLERTALGFGSAENPAPIGFIGLSLAAGDFIGENPGREVAVLGSNGITVFGWDSSFSMTELDSISLPSNGVAIATGAFTRGPSDDLVVTMQNPSDTVAIVFWDGAGNIQLGPLHDISLEPGTPLTVTSGQFDTDGDLDVGYATNSGAGVLLGDGAGGLTAGWFADASPAAIAATSFVGDGIDDLALGVQCADCDQFTPARVLRDGLTLGSYPYDHDPFNVRDIAVGNFSEDPRPDMFIAGGGSEDAPDLIMLFDGYDFNSEDGDFENEVWVYVTDTDDDGSVHSMVVVDLFADGHVVVVIMPAGDEIAIIEPAQG